MSKIKHFRENVTKTWTLIKLNFLIDYIVSGSHFKYKGFHGFKCISMISNYSTKISKTLFYKFFLIINM